MTDRTDEEHPDRATNRQTANLSKEIATNQETKTEDPKQEATNMEVHHHTHASHGKKTWKNYFWEFLMLFLAVFCGFLAEYQLEHVIEHDREKQYIESMIADIKEDSAKINSSLIYLNRQRDGFDSLLQNIYNRPYTDSSLKVMYLIQLKYTHNRNAVRFTKRTIAQLQNSGGLRLIRNKAASDSIIAYNEESEQAEEQADYFEKVRMGKVYEYSLQLFDNEYMFNSTGQIRKDFTDKNSGISLLSNNNTVIKEYANALTFARGSLRSYIFMLNAIKMNIPSKLKFLEDKYDLR